jgi:hypothetical protein
MLSVESQGYNTIFATPTVLVRLHLTGVITWNRESGHLLHHIYIYIYIYQMMCAAHDVVYNIFPA